MTDERWICVTAEGEASVAPDVAVASFAVTGSAKDLAAARDDVNRRSSAVLASLRQLGIADADLTAPDVGIHPEYDYRKGQRLVGYRVIRQMTAKVRDLERLGEVLDGIVAAGANEIHGAQMTASDASAAEHEALAQADTVAAAAGVTLGPAVRIEEEPVHGPPSPKGALLARAVDADVPTEVATGDLAVRRRIRAWFELG